MENVDFEKSLKMVIRTKSENLDEPQKIEE
jgi:hypothetical protein